jgi:hypothetical protein
MFQTQRHEETRRYEDTKKGDFVRAVLFLLGSLAVGLVACSDDDVLAVPYEITVEFNQRYTEADVQSVTSYLQQYDPDGDFRVEESFPPKLRASLTVEGMEFCEVAERELSARSYVSNLRCVITAGLSRLRQAVILVRTTAWRDAIPAAS